MRRTISETYAAPKGRVPERPLFAIGDTHGHADALDALHAHLRDEIEGRYAGQPVDLVYLGDYVDRGPDPLGVLDLVAQGLGVATVTEHRLKGNHDQYLIQAAEIGGERIERQRYESWLRFGGKETLAAMGVEPYSAPEGLRAALGERRMATLNRLELTYRSGDIFCVHAGVHPEKALGAQEEEDLLWIRGTFLNCFFWPHPVTVIHGHTPGSEGVYKHRIGVDTGGCYGGAFTAVEITPEGEVRFHAVER